MLLVNRYDAGRAEKEEMLQLKDITELLGLNLLGVIPESKSVLTATNLGQPVITLEEEDASKAFQDAVARYLGEVIDHIFHQIYKHFTLFNSYIFIYIFN